MTVSCVSLVSTPRAAIRSATLRADTLASSSTPTHSPRPRTARISGEDQGAQARQQMLAEFAAAFDKLFFFDDGERLAADACRQWIAAEGRAVAAWLEQIHHRVDRDERRNRKQTAAERFADDDAVGRMPSCMYANHSPVRPSPD